MCIHLNDDLHVERAAFFSLWFVANPFNTVRSRFATPTDLSQASPRSNSKRSRSRGPFPRIAIFNLARRLGGSFHDAGKKRKNEKKLADALLRPSPSYLFCLHAAAHSALFYPFSQPPRATWLQLPHKFQLIARGELLSRASDSWNYPSDTGSPDTPSPDGNWFKCFSRRAKARRLKFDNRRESS